MKNLKNIFKRNPFLAVKHAPHRDDAALLDLNNIGVKYDGTTAIQGITCQITKGKRIAVIGPNGAGKSTLFKVIAGIIKPDEGKVTVYGSDPSGHICIGYVAQRSQVDWNFPVNVEEVVMMGRQSKIGLLGRIHSKDWDRVHEALETVQLEAMSKKQISELSGGQQQRVFIARAIAQEAELLLLDEPMAGLDIASQENMFNILDNLDRTNITSLISLHDMKMARDHFEQVMLLNHELIKFSTPQVVFQSDVLAQAYHSHIHFVSDESGQLAISDMCCDEGDDSQ